MCSSLVLKTFSHRPNAKRSKESECFVQISAYSCWRVDDESCDNNAIITWTSLDLNCRVNVECNSRDFKLTSGLQCAKTSREKRIQRINFHHKSFQNIRSDLESTTDLKIVKFQRTKTNQTHFYDQLNFRNFSRRSILLLLFFWHNYCQLCSSLYEIKRQYKSLMIECFA